MSRSLPSAAATEAAKVTGAHPVYILEVRHGGSIGTRYYSDQSLASPVTTEGRVTSWGQIKNDAMPEKFGGFSQVTLQMQDADLALRGRFAAPPAGVQGCECFLHLWFDGTGWGDRITLIGGRVAAPLRFDEASAAWTVTVVGREERLKEKIGTVITRQIFPEADCQECQGKIIPIVYGDPVLRVPACLVDRPGQGILGRRLRLFHGSLFIVGTAAQNGFTVGSLSEPVTLVIGGDGAMVEVFTGFFQSADSDEFVILSRSFIDSAGVIQGVYTEGGASYVALDEDDFVEPERNRSGQLLYTYDTEINDQWISWQVYHWFLTGGLIVTNRINSSADYPQGKPYILGALVGEDPIWEVGARVYERGNWTYVVNVLPSKEIVRVEARGKSRAPNGTEVDEWFAYNPAYYTVNLDDKTWNAALGRDPDDDPGLTTVTVTTTPAENGFTDTRLYVTLRGITHDDTPDGDVLVQPAAILKHMLLSRFLGKLDASEVDGDSFDAVTEDCTP